MPAAALPLTRQSPNIAAAAAAVQPALVRAERQLEGEVAGEAMPLIEARQPPLGLEILIVLRDDVPPPPPIDEASSIDRDSV